MRESPVKEPSTRQFSIFQLIVVVTVSALGLTAMTQSSPLLYAVFAMATLVSLLCALLFAIFYPGARRAYWIGFCVWGLGYVTLSGVMEKDNGMDSPVLTSQLLNWTYMKIVRPVPLDPAMNPVVPAAAGTFGPNVEFQPWNELFMGAGQLLWAWWFAAIGGWLAVVCYRRSLAMGRSGEKG
jgi:hypothetical protein